MKGYTVFNVEQIEGLPAQYSVKSEPEAEPFPLIEKAEQFFNRTGAKFQYGGNRAFYASIQDFIQLPPPPEFRDAESYAATKAHELIHWTGNRERLTREFGKRFGNSAYAREELVAELGAAYLAHWLNILKEDKLAIFSAASHAQKAADYLHGLQGRKES